MSADDLLDAAGSLFPDSSLRVDRVRRGDHAMRFVPPGQHAKLAVPGSPARAAALTIWRPSAGDDLLRANARRLLAAAGRTRLLNIASPVGIVVDRVEGSIVEHLSNVFGRRVTVGLMVGSARANRKPVLNIFSSRGDELGFAKVGLGSLANRLVAAEAAALRRLGESSLKEMQVPELISDEEWRGNSVLVMSSLRPDRRQGRLALPSALLDELAGTALEPIAMRDAAWGRRVLSEAEAIPGVASLPDLTNVVLDRYGDLEMRFGPWHGDFGPWNMARTSTVPMVWDWERFQEEMPVGLDATHFLVHRAIAGHRGEALTSSDLLGASARASGTSGHNRYGSVTESSRALLAAYLLNYATRFLSEGVAHDVPGTVAMGQRYQRHLERLLGADRRFKWGTTS